MQIQDVPLCTDQSFSRMSPGHVWRVIQSFSEYKKTLVRVIGFGGILDIPLLQKLNLRFSRWLMNRVDTDRQGIRVDNRTIIKFYAHDVEKVFGIPCGPREISGPDGGASSAAVDFLRTACPGHDREGCT